MNWIEVSLLVVGVYLALGVVVGSAFVFSGVNRVDPVAAHAPLRVRLLLIPGSAALWPLLLRKWAHAGRGGAR
jgi:hypothetical protein